MTTHDELRRPVPARKPARNHPWAQHQPGQFSRDPVNSGVPSQPGSNRKGGRIR